MTIKQQRKTRSLSQSPRPSMAKWICNVASSSDSYRIMTLSITLAMISLMLNVFMFFHICYPDTIIGFTSLKSAPTALLLDTPRTKKPSIRTTITTTRLGGGSTTSSSSSSTGHVSQIKNNNNNNDGQYPPSNLILHGKRDQYTKCPEAYKKNAFVTRIGFRRAFQSQGWYVTSDEIHRRNSSQVRFVDATRKPKNEIQDFLPYQRFSRLSQYKQFDSKDSFINGFKQWATTADQSNNAKNNVVENLLWFLPETHQLKTKDDQIGFYNSLEEEHRTKHYKPWVLKQVRASRGRGITMLQPNIPSLQKQAINQAMEERDTDYIIQAYVCNELSWFGNEKFDLRFYWLVASIDPLIVLFHDGYVRVADSIYDDSDFSNSNTHLTNTAANAARKYGILNTDEPDDQNSKKVLYNNIEDVTSDFLWKRIQQFYNENEQRLSKRIAKATGTSPGTIDPITYVRNQLKESISATADAFKDALTADANFTSTGQHGAENRYSIFGCDFIIDEDLDIYYIEAQVMPQMEDTHDFRVDLFRKLIRPMVTLVEKIANTQELDPKANLMPLLLDDGNNNNIGEYELVYAGDQWRYKFDGYQRITDDKVGCSLKSSPPTPTITITNTFDESEQQQQQQQNSDNE